MLLPHSIPKDALLRQLTQLLCTPPFLSDLVCSGECFAAPCVSIKHAFRATSIGAPPLSDTPRMAEWLDQASLNRTSPTPSWCSVPNPMDAWVTIHFTFEQWSLHSPFLTHIDDSRTVIGAYSLLLAPIPSLKFPSQLSPCVYREKLRLSSHKQDGAQRAWPRKNHCAHAAPPDLLGTTEKEIEV